MSSFSNVCKYLKYDNYSNSERIQDLIGLSWDISSTFPIYKLIPANPLNILLLSCVMATGKRRPPPIPISEDEYRIFPVSQGYSKSPFPICLIKEIENCCKHLMYSSVWRTLRYEKPGFSNGSWKFVHCIFHIHFWILLHFALHFLVMPYIFYDIFGSSHHGYDVNVTRFQFVLK